MRIVDITNIISDYLGLRYSAKQLFDYLKPLPESELTIDFTDVVFISRSFAHEYLTQKEKSKKHINEINVPKEINKMFQVVERFSQKRRLNTDIITAISI
jgi:hypothetical protein